MTTVLMFFMVFMLAYGIYFLCTHLEKEEKNGNMNERNEKRNWPTSKHRHAISRKN